MELEQAIRTRRTHKAYGDEPLSRQELDALLELARWAPNHHLTEPWRFRVVGPRALSLLKEAAGPDASKLARAPTLVVASAALSGDPAQDEEDLHAAACAVYAVLLGAHARGLAGYWRTPAVLHGEAGRAAVDLSSEERVLGLLHLGPRREEQRVPERSPVERYVTYLP